MSGTGDLRRRLVAACGRRTNAPKYTPQQVEAAKKLVTQLGGRLREDAQGNVISIDMAAGRTWADDYQMDQILVFPKLASLVVEGPGITNQLAPCIAEQQNLTSLTLKNTLVDDDGIAELVNLKALKIVELRVAPLISDRAMELLVKLPKLRAVRWSAAISPTRASPPCSGPRRSMNSTFAIAARSRNPASNRSLRKEPSGY